MGARLWSHPFWRVFAMFWAEQPVNKPTCRVQEHPWETPGGPEGTQGSPKGVQGNPRKRPGKPERSPRRAPKGAQEDHVRRPGGSKESRECPQRIQREPSQGTVAGGRRQLEYVFFPTN